MMLKNSLNVCRICGIIYLHIMMQIRTVKLLMTILMFNHLCVLLANEMISRNIPGPNDEVSALSFEDICTMETFQPRCLKNEAILISSAIYGRMRIGRCLTAEEVAEFGSTFDDDPRYFGCSENVLSILDGKCSGKADCDVRLLDISTELHSQPCFSSLKAYLEVGHECVRVADADSSCALTVSNVPSYIIGSSDPLAKCATQTQPWLVEAPTGQRIKVTLVDFTASQSDQNEEKKKISCPGAIVDKAAKRNISLCVGGDQRTKYLYSSSAETLEIYYNITNKREINKAKLFALKFEAVGCTDLIPPEDAWLKRSDDSIVIGCYSNRQTWQLHCEGERWIGVFGNCSQAIFDPVLEKPEIKENNWSNDQILTVFAVGGLTVAICLAVLCTGIVCLRKFSTTKRKNEDYKILDLQFNSSVLKSGTQTTVNGVHSSCATHQQMAPTYSVFVGDGEFNDNSTNYTDNNMLSSA